MKRTTLIVAALFISASVLAQSGLKKGAKAPEFKAKDNYGKTIDMQQILRSHKAMVLFFYRGQWCPYCNKYIQQLQDSLQLLAAEDAYVVGVTPETGENIDKTISKTHASFSMIQDKGYKLMKAYDVLYTVDDATLGKLNQYGINLEMNNGNMDHALPVPATYIIDKSGHISFVHFDKDYTKRASVRSLLEELKK